MANGNDDTMEAQIARLDAKVESLDKKVESLDKKVESLDKKVGSLDKKVGSLDKKVDTLANSTKMQFEAIREDIKKLGEGYESGFKTISRQFENLDKAWTARWSLHDAALTNHAHRITKLEKRQT
jgi:archaellum component FlaC